MATLTKIIRQGNSQALRIPAEYHLKSKEVEIQRIPRGLLIIDPAETEKVLTAWDGILGSLKEKRASK